MGVVEPGLPLARRRQLGAAVLALLPVVACTSALKEPPPVSAIGGGAAAPAGPAAVDRELGAAAAAFAKRPDHGAVQQSRSLFLTAARADETRVDGLLGAMRASAWLVEHESDPVLRGVLAAGSVQLGQWCQRRAPGSVECDYALALAVGQQARERPATAVDGLKVMVELLDRVASAAPELDSSGPDRVLALVLLRAPGWPAGPGDPEAGLERARRAVARAPDHPPNQLVLGEALRANGLTAESQSAYQRALALAERRIASGDPDAVEWRAEAVKALGS